MLCLLTNSSLSSFPKTCIAVYSPPVHPKGYAQSDRSNSHSDDAHHRFHQGVMTMDIHSLWIIVGLIPYSINQHQTKEEQVLTVKALFWRLTIHWKQGQCSWDLYIPFIEHLQQ